MRTITQCTVKCTKEISWIKNVIFPLMPLNYDNLIVAHNCSCSIFSQGKMRFSLWQCLFVSELQNTNVLTCIIADPCNTITMVYPISLSLIRQRYETAVKVWLIPKATPCISVLRRAGPPLAICSWALTGRSVWFQMRDAASFTTSGLSTLLWSSSSHVFIFPVSPEKGHSSEHCGEQ